MIAFSVCDKPFKPLGIPSGRVESREGLTEVMPTNNFLKFFFFFFFYQECHVIETIVFIHEQV
jgi:hypothetical protein